MQWWCANIVITFRTVAMHRGLAERRWHKNLEMGTIISCATLIPYPMPMRLERRGWLGAPCPDFPTLAPSGHHAQRLLHLSLVASPSRPSLSPLVAVQCLLRLDVSYLSERSEVSCQPLSIRFLVVVQPWRALLPCPRAPLLPRPRSPLRRPRGRRPQGRHRRCRSGGASSMATSWCSALGEQVGSIISPEICSCLLRPMCIQHS